MDNEYYRKKFGADVYDIWEELQHIDEEISRKDPYGYFSDGQRESELIFGQIVGNTVVGKCLDVGCGILPLPSYMQNQPDIEFIGIDPYDDKVDRQFEFVQGIAEELPFGDNIFDGVVFATSLDHVFSVEESLKEAYRVLKQGGKVIVWYTAYDKLYVAGTKLDKYHQWALTDDMLVDILKQVGFNTVNILEMNKMEHVLVAIKH